MAATVNDYAAQMMSALAVSEPELDTSIGSPTRKIIDAVAEVAAGAEVDTYLLDYTFDIDSKTGADLDTFVLFFGITRYAANRATGVVTLTRPPTTDDTLIPAGVTVATSTIPSVSFITTVPVFIYAGQSAVDVPVIAAEGGRSGNVAAGAINALSAAITGLSSVVTNPEPTSGGTNAEDDASLIARFKRTVFRSLAGTEDMYLGVATEETTPDNPDDQVASQVTVIGATRTWREQVQIGSDGTATSTIPPTSVKYVYPGSSFLGPDLDAGDVLTENVHYTISSDVPPVVTGIGSALDVDGLYDLSFDYVPTASRNDPANGITNRVDIWVNGGASVPASETVYFRTSRVFTGDGGALPASRYVREGTEDTAPAVGNFFLQLAFGPVTTFPDALTVNGVAYAKGTDYWVVHDDTADGYGATSSFGLEWMSNANSPTAVPPPDNYPIDLTGDPDTEGTAQGPVYTYNRLPGDVEARARTWRLVGSDVRAHAAKQVLLRFGLAVMFTPGYDRTTTINNSIRTALAQALATAGFGVAVQVSDLMRAVTAVEGVDNARPLDSAEAVNGVYGLARVSSSGALMVQYETNGRPHDVILADNEVPALYDIVVLPRAQNTFGAY